MTTVSLGDGDRPGPRRTTARPADFCAKAYPHRRLRSRRRAGFGKLLASL
jgi:hypothetical protein